MWRAVLGLLVLATAQAEGYSPARPVRHDVPSPNGAFVLDVDPATKRLTVYAAGDRTRPLWGFNRPVWQEQHFLSDDGQVVAIVSWRYVRVDDVPSAAGIEFWGRAGLSRAYTVGDLCPDPAALGMFEVGPVGDFWRKWHSEVEADGITLRVRTTDKFEYAFALEDGRIVEATHIGLPGWAWWTLAGLAVLGLVAAVRIRRAVRRRRTPACTGHEPRSVVE